MLYSRAAAGVDLSLGRAASSSPANGGPLSLSVRDAPTINSLVTRAPRRVDALLERLAPASPHSPHSVIVHHHARTPSPPDSNEDSADSGGPISALKRKRKPERTVRLPAVPPLAIPSPASPAPHTPSEPRENGRQPTHPAARSASCETIDDIAAMIASTDSTDVVPEVEPARADEEPAPDAPAGCVAERLVSVLASPEPVQSVAKTPESPPRAAPDEAAAPLETAAAAPRRRSARLSSSEAGVAPVVSPEEACLAESELPAETNNNPPPDSANFVEVENQLEKMFAGLEPEPALPAPPTRKKPGRRKSSAVGDGPRRRAYKRKAIAPRPPVAAKRREAPAGRDADSGSSSSRSRGPYVQVRASSDIIVNVTTGDDDGESVRARRKPPRSPRNGLRARGLHGSTLGARYDATTPDATWVCSFCELGPHAGARDRDAASARPMGDLFGPYSGNTRCEEYLSMDEAEQLRWADGELWTHEDCAVWAPGVLAAGARTYQLAESVWQARAIRCNECGRGGAGVACLRRSCPARCHFPCAVRGGWSLDSEQYHALCEQHARAPP